MGSVQQTDVGEGKKDQKCFYDAPGGGNKKKDQEKQGQRAVPPYGQISQKQGSDGRTRGRKREEKRRCSDHLAVTYDQVTFRFAKKYINVAYSLVCL